MILPILIVAAIPGGCATTDEDSDYEQSIILAARNQNLGNFDEAVQYHRQAVDEMQKTPSISTLDLAVELSNLASALNLTGRPDEAEVLLSDAYDLLVADEETRPDARALAVVIANMTRTAELQGEFEDAAKLYQRSMELQRRFARWPDHFRGSTYAGLARVYLRRGDLRTANGYFGGARRYYRKGPGLDNIHWKLIEAEYEELLSTVESGRH